MNLKFNKRDLSRPTEKETNPSQKKKKQVKNNEINFQ